MGRQNKEKRLQKRRMPSCMLSLLLAAVAAMLFAGASSAPLSAQDVSPADGEATDARVLVLEARQDAYVSSLAPDTNFGGAEEL